MSFLFDPPQQTVIPVLGEGHLFPVRRVYCVGRNYAEHAREMGASEREAPFFFSKPSDAVHCEAVMNYPSMTADLHHEVELVVALDGGGEFLSPEQCAQKVFGYAVGVDLTRRDLQAEAKQARRPWDLAKGFDGSAPISAIRPAQDCFSPQQAGISLSVNGSLRQQGTTADMIWSVPDLLSELSRYVALRPGDLVFTGTPAGVSALHPGDQVEAAIEGVGRLVFSLVGH